MSNYETCKKCGAKLYNEEDVSDDKCIYSDEGRQNIFNKYIKERLQRMTVAAAFFISLVHRSYNRIQHSAFFFA